jgi:RNA polymerase sigma-70 factor, ECF subfamily
MRHEADRIARAEALWTEFGAAVSRALLAYERDPDRRQDLMQDVFLAVLGSVDRIAAAKSPKAYVLRVAHNVASDHIARELRHAWVELDDAFEDAATDPVSEADASGERERLLGAVRRLRLPYRQVITLALEGFEHDEIGEVLGINPGTVRVRYLRAKARLRELLGHE